MSKRVRIPKQVTLGSHTFVVRRVSSEVLERRAGIAAYGLFLPENQEILIIEQGRRGRGPSHSLCLQTYFHELAHAILWTANHRDYVNEKVVDQLGHLLKQAQETAV